MKFNLEKLITTPITDDPYIFLSASGCGCAFGLGYVATDVEINWTPFRGSIKASSNQLASKWKYSLYKEYPALFRIFRLAEEKLFNIYDLSQGKKELFNELPKELDKITTYEGVKKWLIDQLVALGVTETPFLIGSKDNPEPAGRI